MSNNTAVATPQAFQERMFNRIREQMGDLMTDDELKALLDSAMQKAFFEERVLRDSYGNVRESKPPYFVELVQKELQNKVQVAAQEWMANNPETVEKLIQETIAKGMANLVLDYLSQQAQTPLYTFANELRSRLAGSGIHI